MNRLHDVAQLLVACWSLAGADRRIPTSHGLLDRALQTACDQQAFPSWAREQLHFVDSRIGLQCVELPWILDWAQRGELTAAPNPTYHFTEVKISESVSRSLVSALNIDPEVAKQWGHLLRHSLEEAKMDYAAIEPVEAEA